MAQDTVKQPEQGSQPGKDQGNQPKWGQEQANQPGKEQRKQPDGEQQHGNRPGKAEEQPARK